MYALIWTGFGGSLNNTWPVMSDILSILPVMGERQMDLNILINGLVSAIGSSFLTLSPSFFNMFLRKSAGKIARRLTTLTE